MKINVTNTKKLDDLLDGQLLSHGFFRAKHLKDVVKNIEKDIELLPKKEWVGIKATAVSGGPVSSGYKYKRNGHQVTFERTASGWFITCFERIVLRPSEGGTRSIHLSAEQKTKITNALLESHNIR